MLDNESLLTSVLDNLIERYEYIRHLGGGEFSNVYLVRHSESGIDRVLKILDYHYLLQRLKKQNLSDTKHKFDEIKRRFIVEARLYEKINHPNIVKIRDTDVLPIPEEGIEIPYFLMTYIKGSNLAEVIKDEAPLETGRVKKISRGVLGALAAMHNGNVIHRDIKASNIMIEEETGEAVIIDFGIAKDIVGGTKLTTTGALLGSPAYMAPEQFIDSSNVTPSLDIYSFGVVLFEMLTGATPFKGGNFIEVMNAHRQRPIPVASELIPGLPQGADFILAKSMAKDPRNRYKSAQELMDALEMIHVPQEEPEKPKTIKSWWPYAVVPALLIMVTLIIINFGSPSDIKPGVENDDSTKPITQKPAATSQKNGGAGDGNVDPISETGDPSAMKTIPITHPGLAAKNSMEKTPDTGKMIKKEPTPPVDTTERDFSRAMAAAKKSLNANQFASAETHIKKAEALKGVSDREVKNLRLQLLEKKDLFQKKNGTLQFQQYNDTITLKQYLGFLGSYPDSIYLVQLKKRLRLSHPTLPPEKYWQREIHLNSRGYYELLFDDVFNRHHMIYIPSRRLWIDKYEVSNAMFRRYKTGASAEAVDAKPGSKFIHGGDQYPTVVTLLEAEAYCKQFGFRLPRIDEWEFAAGKHQSTYPWGNQAPNADGIWRANYDTLGDTAEQDGFNGTAPVDSFLDFASPFNVVNMSGNVWEWVQGGILKGGSFFSSAEDLMIKKSRGGRGNDKEGFRCILDEKPGEEPGEKPGS